MAYSVVSKKNGTTYYLHSKESDSRGGKRLLYFFKKEIKNDSGYHPLDEMPAGWAATESSHTGLPLLTKKAGKA